MKSEREKFEEIDKERVKDREKRERERDIFKLVM